jgi:hypothetical protein
VPVRSSQRAKATILDRRDVPAGVAVTIGYVLESDAAPNPDASPRSLSRCPDTAPTPAQRPGWSEARTVTTNGWLGAMITKEAAEIHPIANCCAERSINFLNDFHGT